MNNDFNNLLDTISDEISNEETGHTKFQIENFIIKAEPTDYGQYKQCVKELRGREKQCRILYSEIEDLNKKIKSKDKKKYLKQLSDYQILLEDIKRETYIFYDIFLRIKEKINLKNRDELELEYWNAKFEKQLLTYFMIGSPPPPALIESIQCLPSDKCPVVNKMIKSLMAVQSSKVIEHITKKEIE